ncbi:MAG: carbon storage regulator [Candidatus Peribacteraceae bacterium]
MLVLTRKADQKIQIGSGITVTVLEVKGRHVRLGIEAPVEVPIVRSELIGTSAGLPRAPQSPPDSASSGEPVD